MCSVTKRLVCRAAASAKREARTVGNLIWLSVPIYQRHIISIDQIGTILTDLDRYHRSPRFLHGGQEFFPILSSGSADSSAIIGGRFSSVAPARWVWLIIPPSRARSCLVSGLEVRSDATAVFGKGLLACPACEKGRAGTRWLQEEQERTVRDGVQPGRPAVGSLHV